MKNVFTKNNTGKISVNEQVYNIMSSAFYNNIGEDFDSIKNVFLTKFEPGMFKYLFHNDSINVPDSELTKYEPVPQMGSNKNKSDFYKFIDNLTRTLDDKYFNPVTNDGTAMVQEIGEPPNKYNVPAPFNDLGQQVPVVTTITTINAQYPWIKDIGTSVLKSGLENIDDVKNKTFLNESIIFLLSELDAFLSGSNVKLGNFSNPTSDGGKFAKTFGKTEGNFEARMKSLDEMVSTLIKLRSEYLQNKQKEGATMTTDERKELNEYKNQSSLKEKVKNIRYEIKSLYTLPTFLQIVNMVSIIKQNFILMLILHEELLIFLFADSKFHTDKFKDNDKTKLIESGIRYYFKDITTYNRINGVLKQILDDRRESGQNQKDTDTDKEKIVISIGPTETFNDSGTITKVKKGIFWDTKTKVDVNFSQKVNNELKSLYYINLNRRSKQELDQYFNIIQKQYVSSGVQAGAQRQINSTLTPIKYDAEGYLSNTMNVQRASTILAAVTTSFAPPGIRGALALSAAF